MQPLLVLEKCYAATLGALIAMLCSHFWGFGDVMQPLLGLGQSICMRMVASGQR